MRHITDIFHIEPADSPKSNRLRDSSSTWESSKSYSGSTKLACMYMGWNQQLAMATSLRWLSAEGYSADRISSAPLVARFVNSDVEQRV